MEYFKTYDFLPEDAISIRTSVFIEEQGFSEEFDHQDMSARHIVLYTGNHQPAAVCRYFESPERESYIVGRVAVLQEFRKRHYGTVLLREAERQIKIAGAKNCIWLLRCAQKDFMRNLVFSVSGKSFWRKAVLIPGCAKIWKRDILSPHLKSLYLLFSDWQPFPAFHALRLLKI